LENPVKPASAHTRKDNFVRAPLQSSKKDSVKIEEFGEFSSLGETAKSGNFTKNGNLSVFVKLRFYRKTQTFVFQ
jgi:hypothetical protein